MIAQEALAWFKEELKDGKCSDNCLQCNAYEVAIEALEKQIPEKPKNNPFKEGILTTNYECPDCGCRRLGHTNTIAFCPDCGQALDWSDTE